MDTLLQTAEIRWILDGALPTAVERWFGDAGDVHPETRADRYVVLPGCDTVGIKLRGTDAGGPVRLDVKARHGPDVGLSLAPGIGGQAAAWSKWTLELVDRDAIGAGLEPPTPTLTTHKHRRMRRYVTGTDRPRPVPLDDAAEDACDVELTTITIDGLHASWWSLGFEALGPPERAWRTLRSIGRGWFRAHGPPPLDSAGHLDARSSTAYPAWLVGRLGDLRRSGPGHQAG